MILRRCALAAFLFCACSVAAAADPAKVLHLATSDIDTLDPHQLQDVYSRDVASVSFEGMFEWSYLDRPPVPVPRTAAGEPEISVDGKTWTIRIKPGIFFTDDPAFGGKRRELTARDYVFSIERSLDPNLRGGGDPLSTDLIVGMRALVDAARKPGAHFDYDAPVEGLRALDRFTLQFKFTGVNYPIARTIMRSVAI